MTLKYVKMKQKWWFVNSRGGKNWNWDIFLPFKQLFSLKNNPKQYRSDVTAVITWNLLNGHAEHRIHPFIHLDF